MYFIKFHKLIVYKQPNKNKLDFQLLKYVLKTKLKIRKEQNQQTSYLLLHSSSADTQWQL